VLDHAAALRPPIPVEIADWGAFGRGGVVYLAPTATRALAGLQGEVTMQLGGNPAFGAYWSPWAWTPHVTLATSVPPELLGPVAAACDALAWPIRGRIEAIALVEYPDRREHVVCRLSGDAR